MIRKLTSAVIAATAMLLVTVGVEGTASGATPLLVSQGTAFSYLGRSCGGIQEQSVATGFDATSGYPTGDVYLQTRCGGSGKGGGYHVTTYSAWIGVTWDYTGAAVASSRLAAAPTVDPTFSDVDAFGNQVYTLVNAVNVPPANCTVINTTYCSYRAYLALASTFVPPPRVTSVSVTFGPTAGGTSMTVTGTGFTGASAVDFGGTAAASFTVNGDTSITAVSPVASAGTVDVTVTTAGGTSAAISADQFTFIAAPTVSGVSPNSGPVVGGTTVTITGTGFTNATGVSFGDTPIGFEVIDDSSMTVTSPAAEAPDTMDVTVTTVGGTSPTSASDRFTYLPVPAPTVSGASPNSGPVDGGTTVTITGTNFTNAIDVEFGGTPVVFTVNDDASITATSPIAAAPGTVDVIVATVGGPSATSTADHFTYTASTGCGGACPASIQCARLTGTLTGTMIVAKCNPKSLANRRAFLAASTGTLTWKTSAETTIVSLQTSPLGQGGCSAGKSEYDISGTVVGGTSTYTAVGDTISARACVSASGKVTLVKGTTLGL